MSERTIAALSTPAGEGGIAVIRISGKDSILIADKVFCAFNGKKLNTLSGYSAAYGEIISDGESIDDGVALVFKAPKSYTGEDVVEISVHGGNASAKAVLRALYSAGATPAKAGEFTERAFLNGKLDLSKAESIMGIISAKSEAALRLSRGAKQGKVSREIEEITNRLLETASSLAAYADYPDEDIEGLTFDNFSALLNTCENRLFNLLSSYDAGKIIREGLDCAIVGKPNVGKSSLMNMLSRHERSIVTDIAGTTRDIVENTVRLGDIILNLSDTAGIHSTSDLVESLGVKKALERLDSSALVLAVFDLSRHLDNDDLELLKQLQKNNTIVVLNKSDLGVLLDRSAFDGFETVEISAKDGTGAKELEDRILKLSKVANLSPDAAVLISERQRSCVERALNSVKGAISALNEGFTLDAVGVCVDDCLDALLELTGKRVTNEVCDEIFRRFCVGK